MKKKIEIKELKVKSKLEVKKRKKKKVGGSVIDDRSKYFMAENATP